MSATRSRGLSLLTCSAQGRHSCGKCHLSRKPLLGTQLSTRASMHPGLTWRSCVPQARDDSSDMCGICVTVSRYKYSCLRADCVVETAHFGACFESLSPSTSTRHEVANVETSSGVRTELCEPSSMATTNNQDSLCCSCPATSSHMLCTVPRSCPLYRAIFVASMSKCQSCLSLSTRT